MNIGIEATTITGAKGGFGDKSGVYRYFFNLVKSLSQVISKKDKLFLYDIYQFALKNMSADLLPILRQDNIYGSLIKAPRSFKLEYTQIDDMPVIRWFAKKIDKYVIEPMSDRLVYGQFIRKINTDLEQNKIKVFHVSETVYFATPGIKQVATVCDIIPIKFPDFQKEETVKIHMRRLRFIREKSDAIIAISANTKNDLVKELHFNPKKVFVTPLAADEAFKPVSRTEVLRTFQKVNEEIEISKNTRIDYKKYLLFFGTLEPRKNLGVLLEAFRDLKKSGQYQGKLVLVGGRGWGKIQQRLRAFVKENLLQKEVICLGFVSDGILNDLINGAQAVVYPSIYEGFGLPPLEAMQAGTPVITTNVSSMPEVVGKAALLFNPADLEALKAYILNINIKPNLARELSQKGIKQAKKFSWKKTAEQTLEIYQRLARQRKT
ncbi:glycosyltransferase family 4 protein [Patescibacteria group bacterium]|nr:glycosyltransferase family 4 protein [Patescibacteria group bacterium]